MAFIIPLEMVIIELLCGTFIVENKKGKEPAVRKRGLS